MHATRSLGRTLQAERAITEMARARDGVVSARQVAGCGLSRGQRDRRVDSGWLTEIFPLVFSLGAPTLRGRLRGALLWAGDDYGLSHRSAAYVLDLGMGPGKTIHVTGPRDRREPDGIRLHRANVALTGDDLRTTTLARTLLDVADSEPLHVAERAWDVAEMRGILDVNAIDAEIACAGKRHGAAVLRGLRATKTDDGTWDSDLERLFLDLVSQAGLESPRRNRHVEAFGEYFKVDFHWPEHRLIIETDGWAFHRHRSAFETDRRRDAKTTAAGWRTIRITRHRLLTQPDEILAELRTLTRRG